MGAPWNVSNEIDRIRESSRIAVDGIRAAAAALASGITESQVAAEAGAGIFGPPIHGVGIEFEESPLPPGHAFFHGEKAPTPLRANTVIAVGNCGLYTGPWGVRVEDTVLAGEDGPEILTDFPRRINRG